MWSCGQASSSLALWPKASATAGWLGAFFSSFSAFDVWAGAADLLLNVMGYLSDEEILSRVGRRVFVDIDPGFGQMWCDLGLHDPFRGHTDFVTLGRNIGRPECSIPTCSLRWLTMAQPVVLEQWTVSNRHEAGEIGAFTSIGAWRGPNGPIEYREQT